MTLSKSDFMLFLRHPACLWLKKFDKAKLLPVDANLQAKFDAGHEFESYAEKLYPTSTRLGFNNYNEYLSLPNRTKRALDQGAQIITQGRFEVDELTCIVDILDRVEGDIFDLIEVKSSTKAKPQHSYDLAFQTIVLEKSGIKIRNISIIHVNKEYVRKGEIRPEKITAKTEVTGKVRSLIGTTDKQIKKAFKVLSQKTIPNISPRFVNQLKISGVQWFSEWLDIYKTLQSNSNPYDIYCLSSPNPQQISELEDKGINKICDIPEELALRPKQLAQIQTTKTNKRIIIREEIKKFLNALEYPLYFFDYETFSSVIPAFDGCSPYGDYPFQYSLHILDSPGAKIRHSEYLHQENSNPMPDLIKKLKRDIGESGSVIAWFIRYEKDCNDRMAGLYPEHKEFFKKLNSRIKDLMVPFSKMWFVDKDFFGTAKLKKVLPALIPELNHKELDISDGLQSRRIWTQTFLKGENHDHKDKIISDLSKYCTLDTLAMVKILEELYKI